MMLIGIVVTPLYLQHLGAEAYGLVGFFALMQAWMNLLDMGLGPTLGRQAAYARGQVEGFETFKRLLKSFEVIFFVLAVIIVFAIYILSDWIAISWIKSESIAIETLVYCVVLMGVMIGLRWFSGLYRSGINGLEDQVWLNVANIILTSLKFLGALCLLAFISQDIRHFFEYQVLIGLIELAAFSIRFYSILPVTKTRTPLVAFYWSVVKDVAPFAVGIAYTAGTWVLITQTDKLILSGVLSLAEFGYFSMISLVAGGIVMLSGPISQAIMPRLTMLYSQDNKNELLSLYSDASQLVTVTSLSVSLMIGLYAEPLIYAWAGDREAAEWGAGVLIWFALGNGVLAIAAFQYYLQSAFGQLRLHVIGSTLSAIIQVPLIFYAATNYGAQGAGITWFAFRTIWFLCWTPVVHRQFIPGFHLRWMLKGILPIAIVTMCVALAMHFLITLDLNQNRLDLFAKLISLGLLLLSVSALSSSAIRQRIFRLLKN
ncbi:polysaccharide biosynthesis domain protein [Oceanobacter sp. RED65]|uniref:Polysaccharide biosynthesis domain protein n=2 Tax=Bermanella marisrubri TaxID=207949 RepID=Q1N4G5_9GAMM|nr:polysaccharide biosynthesis domain protein [Oceanobacter sp. RED65] [Bermanella marisrubri]